MHLPEPLPHSAYVSVVILNWNGCHYLEACLGSLAAQTYANFEVILVDNGSQDGSVDWVARHYPAVRLIANPTNLGFAAGNNQAIAASHSIYVALLNNDTWVEAGWLAALVKTMESDPTVGMCASKMLFARKPGMVNSTGISLDPVGIAWDRAGGTTDQADLETVEIFGPCAGAALYRRSMLEQIGLFDEDFFAYLEDVDLAWRAQLCGWRCLYTPVARVHHIHSGTSGSRSDFKARLLGRNKVWAIAKNYPSDRLILYWPLILLYDLAATVYAIVGRRNLAALAGRWDGIRSIGKIWPKRRIVQQMRRERAVGHLWSRRLEPLILPWHIPARYKHLEGQWLDGH